MPTIIPPAAPRKPTLTFLYSVVLFDAMGMSLVFPVLPELVAKFTSSPDLQSYWYGALSATFGLMQFLMSPMLGGLSDRFGRRPLLLISIFGLGLDFLLMAVAPGLWVLMLARMVGGATAANVSVANAYIADITAAQQRTAAMGRLGAVFGLGFIVGPMLGGLFGEIDLRLPFYVAAGLSLISGLVGVVALPESLPRHLRTPFSFARANPFSALKALVGLHGMAPIITVFTITVLAQFVLEVTWVLYTEFRFGWGPWANGLSLCVVGVVVTLVQGVWLSRLMKSMGERRLILWGLVSSIVAYAAYGLATQGWMMFAIIFADLLGFAVWPALQGLISRSVDETHQGVTMGALNAITSLTTVAAPLIGSSLFAQVNNASPSDLKVGAPYFLSAALTLVALIIATRHFGRRGATDEVSKYAAR